MQKLFVDTPTLAKCFLHLTAASAVSSINKSPSRSFHMTDSFVKFAHSILFHIVLWLRDSSHMASCFCGEIFSGFLVSLAILPGIRHYQPAHGNVLPIRYVLVFLNSSSKQPFRSRLRSESLTCSAAVLTTWWIDPTNGWFWGCRLRGFPLYAYPGGTHCSHLLLRSVGWILKRKGRRIIEFATVYNRARLLLLTTW